MVIDGLIFLNICQLVYVSEIFLQLISAVLCLHFDTGTYFKLLSLASSSEMY